MFAEKNIICPENKAAYKTIYSEKQLYATLNK
jgi:hypothetical protein